MPTLDDRKDMALHVCSYNCGFSIKFGITTKFFSFSEYSAERVLLKLIPLKIKVGSKNFFALAAIAFQL